MTMNLRSPSATRHHPGFTIRDRDWSIHGPMIGPEQTPRWPTDEHTPTDRRHGDIEWPTQERRMPRVPEPAMEEDDFPYISPTQPATCWLI